MRSTKTYFTREIRISMRAFLPWEKLSMRETFLIHLPPGRNYSCDRHCADALSFRDKERLKLFDLMDEINQNLFSSLDREWYFTRLFYLIKHDNSDHYDLAIGIYRMAFATRHYREEIRFYPIKLHFFLQQLTDNLPKAIFNIQRRTLICTCAKSEEI